MICETNKRRSARWSKRHVFGVASCVLLACCDPPHQTGTRSLETGDVGTITDFTGLCLAPQAGTVVQLSACDGTTPQQWTYRDGTFVNTPDECLTVSTTTNAVQLGRCDGAGAQWLLSGGQFIGAGGLCLDVGGGNSVVGQAMQVWTCNGGGNQQFRFNT